MSMIVRVFGQRLFHERASASIWSEVLNKHDSESNG